MPTDGSPLIEDTYAEAFRSLYAEILITARDRVWLDHALNAVTGHASSTIMCDCEAGLDVYVGPGSESGISTPDGRPGAIVQFHVPRFRKDRVEALERVLLTRISQNILTCPTTACFNLLETDPYYKLGRKIAFFGDGHQFRTSRYGRKLWAIPILGGEFILDRRFGYTDGLMGGNLWFMGKDVDSALAATEKGVAAVSKIPGVIMPFPGGIAASGSKAGSRYSFSIASTYEKFCPTLREKMGDGCGLPPGVNSVMEIIMNGRNLRTIFEATQAAINAAKETPGLIRISAGNYNGRLGKSFIYLYPERQPAE
ncbi:MAG: formylmethanofuran--tetrahydromethanopterin N-formyltransferase [Planctomycetales bacterium]